MEEYDFIVIGAGSGGVRASRLAAETGVKVALCEQDRVGGTCVLRGCVPKKLLVYAAQYAEEFADSVGFGWQPTATKIDWPQLISKKNAELERLSSIYRRNLHNSGVDLLSGRAQLVDNDVVAVNGRQYRGKKILLATGGWPYRPDIPGIEHSITSNEILNLTTLPNSLVIIGGGYIAVEFASIFIALGVEVTLIIRSNNILRGFDSELSRQLSRQLSSSGVNIINNTQVKAIHRQQDDLQLLLDNGDSLQCDCLLYATGRRPNSAAIGLEKIGVQLNNNGAVVVDENYRSSVANIFAIGDLTDKVCLTPVAIQEAIWLTNHLFNDKKMPAIDYSLIPTAVFSRPQIASIGLTEDQIDKDAVDVYCSEFLPLKHSLSGRDKRNLFKLLVERRSDIVVGIQLLGDDAAEIIQGFAVAMQCKATKAQFDATIALHPSSAEELVTLRKARTA